MRLIVRRQPKACGEQLTMDDLDGWRLHAIITNVALEQMTAAEVEAISGCAAGSPGHDPGAEEPLRHDPRPGPGVLR